MLEAMLGNGSLNRLVLRQPIIDVRWHRNVGVHRDGRNLRFDLQRNEMGWLVVLEGKPESRICYEEPSNAFQLSYTRYRAF